MEKAVRAVRRPQEAKSAVHLFDPGTHTITVNAKVLWSALKDSKVRYTRVNRSHPCQLHDKGLVWVQQFEDAVKKQSELELQMRSCSHVTDCLCSQARAQCQLLLSLQRELEPKKNKYELHLKQYAAARKHVKQIEINLKKGECLVYRDFVNHHNANGGKVVNLVLCLLWREEDDGPLHVLNIHNFCTDKDTQSADAFFVADVFDFHLQRQSDTHPGTFDRFTKIYPACDHGPHFSSVMTMHNESTFYEKYGKEVESHFLCSYHAFNRCDGAGVQPKELSTEYSLQRLPLLDAHDYARAMNKSEYVDSVAYPFAQINRSISVFLATIVAVGMRGYPLKSYCVVQYHYTDALHNVHWTPGYIRAALFWEDEPDYHMMYLSSELTSFCGLCSSKVQFPIDCEPG